MCPALVQLREALRGELEALSTEPATMYLANMAGVQHPSFQHDTALLTAMQLCIGAGPGPILVPAPVRPPANRPTTRAAARERAMNRRDSPQFYRDIPVAAATARWIRALMNDWCDIYRDVRRREDPLQSPGCRLANLVARHAVAVFAARRKALRMDAGFAVRVRDSGGPLPVARAGHSLFTVMYLTLWPTSITDESTGSAYHGSSVDLSSPVL